MSGNSYRRRGLRSTTARLLVILSTCACWNAQTAAARERAIEYNRDIRPILFDNCFSCHGPDSASRQADLRFDQRSSAVDLGAIVPGDPDSSEMIRRILSDEEAERMPPPETKKVLTDVQKELLAQWIRAGAEYQPHWSLIPPVRPEIPHAAVPGWVKNPIDNFIAERLDAAGLSPAHEADRRTLARRLSLDLTGLPPKPELVEEFVNDTAADAYERFVDRLLASPRWGEHRGRYWLDAARYGDTHGIHADNYREMWSYREWVINKFNENIPYDKFTIENLAGDLLPDATLEQKIGSGFNRCNITTSEGGAISEEYAVLYARDRVETTSQVWMALTAGCAVCHDHKFDPLTQREFYELSAFFNNTTQNAMDGNVKDTPPVVVVPRPEDRARWEQLPAEIVAAERRVEERRENASTEFDTWLATARPDDVSTEVSTSNLDLLAPLDDGKETIAYTLQGKRAESPTPATVEWREGKLGSHAAYLNRGAVLIVPEAGNFDLDQAFSCAVWVKLPANDSSGAIVARMNEGDNQRGWDLWIDGRRIGCHLNYRAPEYAMYVQSREQLPANEWVHVAIVYDGSSRAAGLRIYVNAKRQQTNVLGDTLLGTIRTGVPLKIGQRHFGSPLSGATIQDVRIYSRHLTDGEIASLAIANLPSVLATPPEERSQEKIGALYAWWLNSQDERFQELSQKHAALVREQSEIKSRGTVAHVMQERASDPIAYVLNRGEYDQRLEKVSPGTPDMLPAFGVDLPRNRLGLAKWLVQPEHPLTARVAVNRFWSEVFGTGFVKTAGDFGISGELPSHPKLLDWLAVDFRESGWNVKRLFKLIVTSATYRQSSVATPDKWEKDPDNRLLSRGPRFRMDAEMVRDYALSASGLLTPKIGGPSVKPYQPPGVWEAVAMIGSDTRDYKQDSGEALYRRSLYTFWKRSAPPASMEILNAPSREVCTMVRERTNTPIQALVTLNDPQFIEAARHLAERAIGAHSSDDERTQFIAEQLLARRLLPKEVEIVRGSLEKLQSHYAAAADDAARLIDVGDSPANTSIPAAELAAWTMVANELMNLDEALNK